MRKRHEEINSAIHGGEYTGGGMSYKMKDYDVWYQVCENCGYDTAKSTTKSKNQCWKCGRRIMRDFSDRALKVGVMKELQTGTKPNRYATTTRATLEKIAEDRDELVRINKALVKEWSEEVDTLKAQIADLATITDSMKAECMGEFKESYEVYNSDEEDYEEAFLAISWSSMKDIYKMMLAEKLRGI